MQSTRTFVCLELPEAVRTQAAALQTRLGALAGQIRWVNAVNLHLTLRFLGELSRPQLEAVCSAVRKAAEYVEPFTVRYSGTGCFPSLRRPRIFWIGVAEPTELARLFQAVEQELASAGFPRESRPFSPHLTLGRARVDRPDAGLGEAFAKAGFTASSCLAKEVIVMKSVLGKAGPAYTPIARLPLCGTETVDSTRGPQDPVRDP